MQSGRATAAREKGPPGVSIGPALGSGVSRQSPVPGQTQIPVKRGVQKVESDIWGHCGKEERTE